MLTQQRRGPSAQAHPPALRSAHGLGVVACVDGFGELGYSESSVAILPSLDQGTPPNQVANQLTRHRAHSYEAPHSTRDLRCGHSPHRGSPLLGWRKRASARSIDRGWTLTPKCCSIGATRLAALRSGLSSKSCCTKDTTSADIL